jgi:hypothetical protein
MSTTQVPRSFNASNSRSETIEEETEGTSGGLRASLDAGMARVRRWIRSRPPTPSTQTESGAYSWTQSPFDTRHRIEGPGEGASHGSESDDDNYDDDDDLLDLPLRIPLNDDVVTGGNAYGCGSSSMLHQQHVSEQGQTNTIMERTEDNLTPRQRALSEPDGVRIRDLVFQRALTAGVRRRHPPPTTVRPQRQQQFARLPTSPRGRGSSVELVAVSSSQLSASAAEVVYASTLPLHSTEDMSFEELDGDDEDETSTIVNSRQEGSGTPRTSGGTGMDSDSDPDPQREARSRWIVINQRFQFVITFVALIFSLLLFGILVCWVVLTSTYVVSIDKTCDVPLKFYYWFVTLQLIMDVFRSDIMRLFFRWDASSNQRIPCRVLSYNVGYLTYALLVLRMGINCVFLEKETTCPITAPELFQTSTAFVALSIAAWTTIVLGYLVPFCVVATLLTLNGYTPGSDSQRDGSSFTVFPSVMGAPPGCVDEMPIVMLEDFPAHYPMECCICMENFTGTDVIVETGCQHVFHKPCCRDWLQQARTCPVCRTDIPTALGSVDDHEENQGRSSVGHLGFGRGASTFVGRNDIHHEVVSLFRILRRRDRRQRRADNLEGAIGRPPESREAGN